MPHRSLVLSMSCSCQLFLEFSISQGSKDHFLGVSPERAPCEAVPRAAGNPDNSWCARHHLSGTLNPGICPRRSWGQHRLPPILMPSEAASSWCIPIPGAGKCLPAPLHPHCSASQRVTGTWLSCGTTPEQAMLMLWL